jgi:hypothetical protein
MCLKRIALCGLPVLLAVTTAAAESRAVHGIVLDQNDQPLKGAVIQIKNLRSLVIRSFISMSDGKFYFMGLNPDIDYEIKARYQRQWSDTKSVSRFDSSETVEVVLRIDTKPS